MRKLLWTVIPPVVLVLAVTVGVIWWDRGAPPGFRPTIHDVAVSEVSREHRGVRVNGTAHYPVRLRLTREGGETLFLFPIFEKGDTSSREISVMVQTTRAPDELLGFEDMTVEGLARPPGAEVPRDARQALEQAGYYFTEDFVLIQAFDDPPAP